jgi:hypothetical protein
LFLLTNFNTARDDIKIKSASIGKADEWLVKHAKNAGLDIKNFEHEITSDF